ncbi:GspE/PulE family protein [Dryocola clanedunensis]|uniref:GspE/PulE family protein n=1 Tax=Cedecea sulfonylureivorans TaxID=3051154 RepID=UPI001925C640|nr:ATPase, T2SS/T4P/T4SS family [Cedecea sulfonylureivorans]
MDISLHDILIPAAIAEYVYLSADKFLVSQNDRGHQQIQSFCRQVRDKTGREPEFVEFAQLKLQQEDKASLVVTSENQRKVRDMFQQAMHVGASDIHLRIGEAGISRTLFRINGDLEDIDTGKTEEGEAMASTIYQSMCDMAEKNFIATRQQDGRLKEEFVKDLGLFGARYAHTPTVYGLNVVMRIIPDDADTPPTLEALGFLPEQRAIIEEQLGKPEGMMVLSGPTGSGKSTTLRSMASRYMALTGGKKNLIAVEDPPEGKIAGVQIAIVADRNNPEELSDAWVRTMTAGLRLDPDAMVIGEIRCLNSARTATVAAQTGHIILTTLHSNDAFTIPERLMTFGLSLATLADPQLMVGLISQRLVQTLCPACCLTWDEVSAQMAFADKALVQDHCDTASVRFRNPQGCSHCRKEVMGSSVSQGVTGRIVVAEVVKPTIRMMKIYKEEGRLAARRHWHREEGGITRHEHLIRVINAGLVDPLHAHKICPLDEDKEFLCD